MNLDNFIAAAVERVKTLEYADRHAAAFQAAKAAADIFKMFTASPDAHDLLDGPAAGHPMMDGREARMTVARIYSQGEDSPALYAGRAVTAFSHGMVDPSRSVQCWAHCVADYIRASALHSALYEAEREDDWQAGFDAGLKRGAEYAVRQALR